MAGGFGMPGPMELIIVGLICLGPLVAVGVILFVVFFVRKKASPASAVCPRCGGWTVAGARFCHHCGGPLQGPPSQ